MLNVRMYRIAWLLAIVGILLVLLTLNGPGAVPQPVVPPAINAAAIDAFHSMELSAASPSSLASSNAF